MTLLLVFLLGALLGTGLGLAIGRRRTPEPAVGRATPKAPSDSVGEGVPELILRANRAAHLCMVSEEAGAVHWSGDVPLDPRNLGKVESVARLASSDPRRHAIRDERLGCVVGVGYEGVGVALLIPTPAAGQPEIDRIGDDLERFLKGLLGPPRRPEEEGPYRPAVDSVAGIGFDLCERARRAGGHPCIVVHRAPEGDPVVVAGSAGTDRRLLGMVVGADSLAARACDAEQMLASGDAGDVLGPSGADRRRGRPGVALPLRDGNQGVGALVVLAPPDTISEPEREELMRVVSRLGPSFAAASAVKAAEDRAVTDVLTGLPNRTALARAMSGWGTGPCSLLGVDIDHFKKLNDTYGHAAGDDALQHVAAIFRRALRDQDVPARVGGEEFALWLPGVARAAAVEVAERVRDMIEVTPWHAGGKRVPITCSIGVASVPETSRSPDNLVTAADAALYRAKERGRNRVEVASG